MILRASSIASMQMRRPTTALVALQRRFASSDRNPSAVSVFYKTFTRPVAKVLLMAMFTYQLAYWGWLKLEQDKIRAEREEEIAALEHQVRKAATSVWAKEKIDHEGHPLLLDQQSKERFRRLREQGLYSPARRDGGEYHEGEGGETSRLWWVKR